MYSNVTSSVDPRMPSLLSVVSLTANRQMMSMNLLVGRLTNDHMKVDTYPYFSFFMTCYRYMIFFVRLSGGVLPYKRLMGMCRWMGSHFHDWIDYNGVTRMGSHIFAFLGVRQFFIFTVSKRTRMFIP